MWPWRPFMVPRGSAETDAVARLFTNFRELACILNRAKEVQLSKQLEQVNKHRHIRCLYPGETVFRRMPPKARPGKHLLGEPSTGPYVVVNQSTFNSVRLKDPVTGEWVDKGADIPLEQILTGPRRGALQFETGPGHSIGDMVSGKNVGELPPQVRATGWKPGRRTGWSSVAKGQYVAYQPTAARELLVGYVLSNDKEQQILYVQTCQPVWSGMSIKHLREYRMSAAEGSEVVTEPTEELVRAAVPYRMVVRVVELLSLIHISEPTRPY